MLELVQCMTHTLLTQKHKQHVQFFAVIDGGVIDGEVADGQPHTKDFGIEFCVWRMNY